MKKFDLKKMIAENKATFFSSLNEGQFSWMTQDTDQQIGSQEGNTIPVYMFDNKGKYWFEREYEGYGVFGGKDYYELLDQMNGGKGNRSEGIRKAFDPTTKGETLFPALVVGASNFNYKTHDFTQEAEHDPNQSWLPYEEDEDEDNPYIGDDEDDDFLQELELEEGEAAYEYEKGKATGEKIEKTKMKKSELKAKIKEMIVAEMDGAAVVDSEYDFLKEIDEIDINDPALMKARAAAHQRTLPKSPSPKPTTAEKNAGKINLLKRLKAQYLQFMEMEPEGGPMTDLYNLGTEAIEKIDKSIAKLSGEKNVAESKYDFLKEIEEMLDEAEGLTPLQQYIYDYEQEISGEDQAQEFLDDIKKLNTPDDVYDYYAYERDWSGSMDDDLENIYRQVKRKFKNLNEADKETDVDVEAADDTTCEDTTAGEEIDTTVDVTTDEVNPNVKAVQDALTQAQAAAQQLGDKKLMDQIGNTITFFTRAHVVDKPKGAVAEGEEDDDYEDDDYDLDAEFANSPNQASFEDVFNVIQSYEDDEILDDFTSKFPSIKPINKEKYRNFAMKYIDDMSDMNYIKANWISMFDEDVYEKAGLAENKKPINESMFPMLKKILK